MNQLMNSVHVSMRPATNSSQFVIGITGIQRKTCESLITVKPMTYTCSNSCLAAWKQQTIAH